MNLEQLLVSKVMSPNPRGFAVVPGSLALTHFGKLATARTVTVGINPSVSEFCPRTKPRKLLKPDAKRVVDREVLGIPDQEAASIDDALRVVASYNSYFETTKHLDWFDKFQKWALDPLGVSYFRGDVAHLDLVQWATDPVWRELPMEVKARLIEDGSPFLAEQLRMSRPELVLFNGATVVKEMQANGYLTDVESGPIPNAENFTYYIGRCRDARAIGWSMNIQSQHDSGNQLKSALQRWLSTVR